MKPAPTTAARGVLSLAQLLEHNPKPTPALIEPGLLPASGILFVGGEPKVGKSLLVANLALALASGSSRTGFHVPEARRVLICQFELPTSQFAARLSPMRKPIGSAADSNLLIDTEAAGHLLSAPRGLDHFLAAIRSAKADVVVLDPLYSTHDQDENDTRAMAALCQTLLRLRDASHAALIVVHLSRVVQYASVAVEKRESEYVPTSDCLISESQIRALGSAKAATDLTLQLFIFSGLNTLIISADATLYEHGTKRCRARIQRARASSHRDVARRGICVLDH